MNDEIRNLGKEVMRVYKELPALVESIDDPETLLRVQVRVAGVFPAEIKKESLPWAEVKWPPGAALNAGTVVPFKGGQWVWVDFPYDGDTRRPRITGSMHYAPGGVLNLPHEAWGGPDAIKHKRVEEEPEAPAHEYGKDFVFTINGVTVIVNKDGTFSLIHRETGTEICVDKTGGLVFHCEDTAVLSAVKDFLIRVMEKLDVKAMKGISLDGGSGDPSGVVRLNDLCSFTGLPHCDGSTNVKASKG